MAEKRAHEEGSPTQNKKIMSDECVIYSIPQWIEENKKEFLPPVCNKMIFGQGQMKSFFIGGPNQRKDYHVECGEELFYMRKGDMELLIFERGKHRTIPIKEGEIFLLPCGIMHSPQRSKDTIGWVCERERALCEKDGLRYFVEKNTKPTDDILYEDWFYCTDLGAELKPLIKTFFASEQSKTGKPKPGDHLFDEIPIELDNEIRVMDPFSINDWIDENRKEIDRKSKKKVFEGEFQFQVYIFGKGENSEQCEEAETVIWQWEGKSKVVVGEKELHLNADDMMLIPKNKRYTVIQDAGSLALVAFQDPRLSSTWKAD